MRPADRLTDSGASKPDAERTPGASLIEARGSGPCTDCPANSETD